MNAKRAIVIGLVAYALSFLFIAALAMTHTLDANGNVVQRSARP